MASPCHSTSSRRGHTRAASEFLLEFVNCPAGSTRADALRCAPLDVSATNRAIPVSAPVAIRRQRESGLRLRAAIALLMAAGLAACAPQPEPRTVSLFMEDGLARDGVLARCNQDRDATSTDVECANARRAAAAVALEAERGREPNLERAPDVKVAAFDVYADGSEPLG